MSKHGVHFSSNSDEWETPQWLFDELNNEFTFNVDLCATEDNKKCDLFTSDVNSFVSMILSSGHTSLCSFINPPYSRGKQSSTLRAAVKLASIGGVVVALIPARTDTKLWHELIWDNETNRPKDGVEVRFLKGRLKFEKNGSPVLGKEGKPQSAPFPSAVVVFSGGYVSE